MPSPFPGMNPYLERKKLWPDFHMRFLNAAAEQLGLQIRPGYVARLEERVYIHELPRDQWRPLGRPDLSILKEPVKSGVKSAAQVVESPAEVELMVTIDFEKVPFLEILDQASRDVVTVLELLSPSNKQNISDREQYTSKRIQLLTSQANFVEIDLLRAGVRPYLGERPVATDYYALVSRTSQRPKARFWPIRLRDRLPAITIPLRPPDADASLDMQAALNRIYDFANYESEIYTTPPDPLLSPEDAEWAKQFVPARAG